LFIGFLDTYLANKQNRQDTLSCWV